MGIPTQRFQEGDVYIDYDLEDVMFRFEHRSRRFFRRFYGQAEEKQVPFDSELLNDAIERGDEIDQAVYREGKPKG